MLNNHSDIHLPADLDALVTACGLRMTHAREVLLRALHALDEPTSGEALYRLIVKGRQRVSRSTIYRTLSDFERAGLVCRGNAKRLSGGVAVYRIVKPSGYRLDSATRTLNFVQSPDVGTQSGAARRKLWVADRVAGTHVWTLRDVLGNTDLVHVQVTGSKAIAERVARALNDYGV